MAWLLLGYGSPLEMFQAHKVNGSCTQALTVLSTKYTNGKFKIG